MTFNPTMVQKQKVDFSQINHILEKAYGLLEAAQKNITTSEEASFILAYDCMLKITLALMLSRGYRPKMRLGHHRTLVEFAKHVLGEKFNSLTHAYNGMREKRNQLIYDTRSISKTEAKHSLIICEKYFEVVEDKITEDNPQQKLWKP